MMIVGFIGALCNEFTGVWLVVMVASSLLARRVFGQKLQVAHHVLITAAILIAWLVVVIAKGNSMRMGQLKGAGDLIRSLNEGLNFARVGLDHFFREPVIIGWFVVVAAVTLVEPEPTTLSHPRAALLALGVAAICLACCYFEYFTHEFSTGTRLVERAQNQALILILFGFTLSLSLLVRAYRPKLRRLFIPGDLRVALNSVTFPASLAVVMAAAICLSSTASLIRVFGNIIP